MFYGYPPFNQSIFLLANLPAEAFAHMTETSIHNQKALENIKKYFPKSYELYLEMIENVGDIK